MARYVLFLGFLPREVAEKFEFKKGGLEANIEFHKEYKKRPVTNVPGSFSIQNDHRESIGQSNTKAKEENLIIWGDLSNTDSQTVSLILDIAEVYHTFNNIDSTDSRSKEMQSFIREINPIGTLPVIVHKKTKVFGGDNLFVSYLSKVIKPIKETLAPKYLEQPISRHLEWFNSTMRPVSGRLIRLFKHGGTKQQI